MRWEISCFLRLCSSSIDSARDRSEGSSDSRYSCSVFSISLSNWEIQDKNMKDSKNNSVRRTGTMFLKVLLLWTLMKTGKKIKTILFNNKVKVSCCPLFANCHLQQQWRFFNDVLSRLYASMIEVLQLSELEADIGKVVYKLQRTWSRFLKIC